MMRYELPIFIEIDGISCYIRNKGDYRAVLDTIAALNDPDLSDEEKLKCALFIFYENVSEIPDFEKAALKMMDFINCGEEDKKEKNNPKIMDWEQDLPVLIPPINRIIGKEIRLLEYLHWWTFIGAYYEIGECLFSNIVTIRSKLKSGKPLDKWERNFVTENQDLVNIKPRNSEKEKEYLESFIE